MNKEITKMFKTNAVNGVAISGKFCSGKDLLGKLITNNSPFYDKLSFADALKEIALLHPIYKQKGLFQKLFGKLTVLKSLFEFSSLFKGNNLQLKIISKAIEVFKNNEVTEGKNRKLLQELGTGLREVHPTIWIELMDRNLNMLYGSNCSPVITDLRFKNEYEWCKSNSLITVRLISSKGERVRRAKKLGYNITEDRFTHKSETELDRIRSWDFAINSDGNEKDLIRNSKPLLDVLGIKIERKK